MNIIKKVIKGRITAIGPSEYGAAGQGKYSQGATYGYLEFSDEDNKLVRLETTMAPPIVICHSLANGTQVRNDVFPVYSGDAKWDARWIRIHCRRVGSNAQGKVGDVAAYQQRLTLDRLFAQKISPHKDITSVVVA